MTENDVIRREDEQCWALFQEKNHKEQMTYWNIRGPKLKKDYKREHKGEYYLGLSIISIIGGFAGLIYGLAGKDWVQKPYVIFGALMVLMGLSIVIGGFGKVKG